MRFLLQTVSIIFFAGIFQLFSPFWIIGIIAFLVGIIYSERPRKWAFSKKKQRPNYSFAAGFLAIFLLWGIMAMWLDSSNESLLSQRMADFLLQGQAETIGNQAKPYILIGLTGFMGGLFSGAACMMGNALGEIIKS